jgi:hypothetical protein
MAFEDDDYGYGGGAEGPASQTNYGLASNAMMPMGDPLAYARVGAAPETNVPGIHTQGVAPQPIVQPRPINVPDIPAHKEGADDGNALQPMQQDPTTAGPNLNSLQGLLQMKGLEDLAGPSGVGATPAVAPTPGAGAGPGRVPSGVSIAKAAAPYQDMVNDAADKNGLDRNMFRAQLYQESQFNPNAKSPAGAQGIGQFIPSTAKERGVDVNDPKSSIYGAASYLGELKQKYKDDGLALAAYNWGPGNVDSWLKTGRGLKGPLPDETKNYVQTITGKPLARPAGPVSQMTPPAANDPNFLPKYKKWMEDANSGRDDIKMRPPGPSTESGTSPTKNFPTVGPMFGGPAMNAQNEQPFKPYMIAGAMQPPPSKQGSIVPSPVEKPPPGHYRILPDEAHSPTFVPDADKPAIAGPTVSPAVEQFNRPPVVRGGQTGVSPAVQEANRNQPPVQWPPRSGAYVPGPTYTPTPGQDQPQQQQPPTTGQTPFGLGSDPMQRLWKYMLIKSLFPQLQFKNIGYDPWKVHRLGQSGGY